MKKLVLLLAIVFLLTAITGTLVGCNKATEADSTAPDAKYADGVYFAQEDDFNVDNGWKYMVTITVTDGKITEAIWNGANQAGGNDKITQSTDGSYGMVAYSDAQSEWHEQAILAQDHLLATQEPTDITYSDDEGHTDAITGVSIHVREFFGLAEKALAADPNGYGTYTDGTYTAEKASFSETSGWKENVSVTVISGRIVAAGWNGVHKDGGDDKVTQSMDGRYGMVAYSDAQSEWHEQSVIAQNHLLMTQDPTDITYSDDEGHTDALTGVSIHVSSFFELVAEALAGATK
ncbi:MAG: hypothetical protein PF505_11425 [Vallitaleaceae bacterium]|nr:hypothetical protein [Vallitaleaceae bacterium]